MKNQKGNRYKQLAKVLKKWRQQSSLTLYRIAKDEGVNWDNLKRIEEGKGVTTDTLLAYLHFCRSHNFDPLSVLWKDETPINASDNTSASTSDSTSSSGIVSAITEADKEENIDECTTSVTPSDHQLVVTPTEQKSIQILSSAQEKKYLDDTPKTVPQQDKKIKDNVSVIASETSSDRDTDNTVNQTVGSNTGHTVEGHCEAVCKTPGSTSEKSVASTIENDTALTDDKHTNTIDKTVGQCKKDHTNDHHSSAEKTSVTISEDTSDDTQKNAPANTSLQGKPIYANAQIELIKLGICPVCNKPFGPRRGFLGHVNDDDAVKCNYTAMGKLDNPDLFEEFLPFVIHK